VSGTNVAGGLAGYFQGTVNATTTQSNVNVVNVSNTATTGSGHGILSTIASPNGAGLYGVANGANAVGVVGQNLSTSGSSAGVVAISATTSGSALQASNSNDGGQAGNFHGGVYIGSKGNLIQCAALCVENTGTDPAGDIAVQVSMANANGWAIGAQNKVDGGQAGNFLGGVLISSKGNLIQCAALCVENTGTDPSKGNLGVQVSMESPNGWAIGGQNKVDGGQAGNFLGGVLIISKGNLIQSGALYVENTGAAAGNHGIVGVTDAPVGDAAGVIGLGTGLGQGIRGGNNSASGVGVLGYNSGGGLAGQFNGNVQVNGNLAVSGTISKGGGSFRIDHPLDPENKYLYHSFVESPDMKNIYDGVVVLDQNGEATITLPDWFEALNEDFRYQLTCIGGYAQVYVAREVSGNTFRIGGGHAGLKVSWQVTGIRHDTYANEHRIPVEEVKPLEP
jgi:hypothetical protein